MKHQVQLESEVGRGMFATLVTPAHRTSSAACHVRWHWYWRSVHVRTPMRRCCLENKHALVRFSYLVDGDNHMTIFTEVAVVVFLYNCSASQA